MLKNSVLTISCVILLAAFIAGCTGKNKAEEEAQEEVMSLSVADTTQVTNLMNQYFDCLMKKDYDGAMSMISQLKNDSLKEMTPELKNHYMMGMKLITPIRYQIEYMVFETEQDCLVKYSAVLFEKEGSDDKRPNKMHYAIKPVRIDGKWYLTVADGDDVNTRNSNIAQ